MRSEFLWLVRCSQRFMIRSIILTILGGIYSHMDVHNFGFLYSIISVASDSSSKPPKNIDNSSRVSSMHTIVISRSLRQHCHLLLIRRYPSKKRDSLIYPEIRSSSTRISRIVLRRRVLIHFRVLHLFLRNQPRMRRYFFVWIFLHFQIMTGEDILRRRLLRVIGSLILPRCSFLSIGGGSDSLYYHSHS